MLITRVTITAITDSVLYDATEIEELSLAMSKIFRYAVKKDTIVTLAEELQCVSEYMHVMTLRFPSRYTFRSDMEEHLQKVSLPKMTLQPIVENCFKYGITNNKKQGIILLRGYQKEDTYIEIIDTGKGISEATLTVLKEKIADKEEYSGFNEQDTRLGLRNIDKRIKLCFGKAYRLTLISKEGYYTKVILKLPKESSKLYTV